MDSNDFDLLRQYVHDGSREAFDTIVRRHIDMVYAAARRQVGDPNVADDVTQAVFIILMRKAHGISPNVCLAGWLFKVVRYAAADFRKSAARREHHEKMAAAVQTMAKENATVITQLLPEIDEAISSLPRADRDAVVMSYLEGKSHGEIAAVQRISENAARQRLFRAITRLRTSLRRRGIHANESALSVAAAVSWHELAPPTLLERIKPASANPSERAASLVNQTLWRMLMMKVKTIAIVTAALFFLLATVAIPIHLLASDGEKNPLAAIAPATQPSANPAFAPAATPKATVQAAFAAACAGDENGFISCFDQPSPADRQLLTHTAHILSAASDLKTAVKDKFGEKQADGMFQMMGPGVGALDVSQSEEAIDGQTATVDLHSGPGKVPVVKVGEVWKISTDVFKNTNREFVAAEDGQVPAIRDITANIKAGKYQSIEDLTTAAQQLLQKMQGQ